MRIFLVAALCFILACHSKTEQAKQPDDLLTAEQMVPLLADMHLLDSYDRLHPVNPDSALMRVAQFKLEVCSAHHVSVADFDSSFNYYCAHPELLDPIYDEVLNTFSRMQAEEAR